MGFCLHILFDNFFRIVTRFNIINNLKLKLESNLKHVNVSVFSSNSSENSETRRHT